MQTRFIEDALSMLERSRNRMANFARSSDDYRFLKEIDCAIREANVEVRLIHQGPTVVERVYRDPPEMTPTECYCNAGNAPCGWCETHCPDCEEHDEECTCEGGNHG